jgi:phycocyanobilin lyase alpha subunit
MALLNKDLPQLHQSQLRLTRLTLPMSDFSSPPELLTEEQAILNLTSPDLGLRYYAAWWLGRFKSQNPTAVSALITALEDESDRSPDGGYPLRRNAARALGQLGDPQAVAPLITCLLCSDFYVREAAAQSLELLGDPICIPALIQTLTSDGQPSQEDPNLPQPYDALIEALGTLQAREAIDLIIPFLDHPLGRVRCAAARALYQLTQDPVYAERLIQALKSDELQLRRTVMADLGAIGYYPAAAAIAETLAENSLKLLALQGILEHEVKQSGSALSPSSRQVMRLMDNLL